MQAVVRPRKYTSGNPRCYTDASTSPDILPQVSRKAGLGVLIISNQTGIVSSVYIKALLKNSTSVLMVEAAALALGAQLLTKIDVQQPSFLSDNQKLVSFFSGKDHSNPPQWEIKPFTQGFQQQR